MIGYLKKLLIALTPFLLATGVSMGADGSNTDSHEVDSVRAATLPVIFRVPLDQYGRQLAHAMEMRMYTGAPVANQATVNPAHMWNQSVYLSNQHAVRNADDGMDQGADQVDTRRFYYYNPGRYYYWQPYGYYAYYYYPSYPYYYYHNYYTYYPYYPYHY
ncbi:hypothetical protein [Oligoflexus tunisiensis]|uniref:hypothetical protein n=1 Tax=Oligoflexus tunisiensis TaxID=708132 RepID=UPI00114CD0E5|nr:hypothetical protein [Oligoflexus tunisiensis]